MAHHSEATMHPMRSGLLSTLRACTLLAGLSGPAIAAQVSLDDADWTPQSDAADVPALRAALLAWHRAWAGHDLAGCRSALDPAVLRALPGVSGLQSGRDEVLAALAREWAEYEQDPSGASARRIALRDGVVQRSGDAALLHDYAEIEGGARWGFEDTAAHAAMFTKSADDGRWRLAFAATASSLTLDSETDSVEESAAGRSSAFDYAIPVRDLDRATRFYQPLLGEPEAVVADPARAARTIAVMSA